MLSVDACGMRSEFRSWALGGFCFAWISLQKNCENNGCQEEPRMREMVEGNGKKRPNNMIVSLIKLPLLVSCCAWTRKPH